MEQDIFEPHFYSLTAERKEKSMAATLENEAEFERVFKMYFKALHAYAYTIVKNEMAAEEIVQGVFLKIWEKKAGLHFDVSVKAYLYRAVHNESLNALKHQKVKMAYEAHTSRQMKDETDNAAAKLLRGELEGKIRKALNELPEQCRTIFQLSRFEELKYQEIANQLGLSIKTVEAQMGKALKLLRLKLVEFLPLVLLALLNILNRSL